MIFFWQQKQWEQLLSLKKKNKLPHALLFAGMSGLGKLDFTKHFLKVVFCELNQDNFCGQCHACHLIDHGSHPNIYWLQLENASSIKVDQVREANEFIQHSSLQNGYRFLIIQDVDKMNLAAANALLKTLEEPPPGAFIILISEQPTLLPATLISRCQRIQFTRPPFKDTLAWLQENLPDQQITELELLLKLAYGSPQGALTLFKKNNLEVRHKLYNAFEMIIQNQKDPIDVANEIYSMESPLLLIDFSLNWLIDLLRIQLGASDNQITNIDYLQSFSKLKFKTNIKKNLSLLSYLKENRQALCRGLHLNKQLLIESILIRWMECA